jgi:hypothetical protein
LGEDHGTSIGARRDVQVKGSLMGKDYINRGREEVVAGDRARLGQLFNLMQTHAFCLCPWLVYV